MLLYGKYYWRVYEVYNKYQLRFLKLLCQQPLAQFNCACAQTTVHGLNFELMRLVQSSVFFLTKNSVRDRRDLVTNVLYDGQCRAWRNHSLNIVRCWSREVCTATGYFLKLNDACNKTHRLALGYVENCRSKVSFVAFSCLDGQK